MPDTQPERQNLRQLIRQRRKSLSQAEQQAAAQQLVERFQEHPGILAARRIALYLANDGELDPLPAIHWLWARQRRSTCRCCTPSPRVTCSSCATPPPPP